jgi:hypothetical protein
MRARLEREHDLAAGIIGRGTAAVAGVAALRHDTDALLVAEGQQARDLLDAARHGDAQRAAVIELAMIDEKGRISSAPSAENRRAEDVAPADLPRIRPRAMS